MWLISDRKLKKQLLEYIRNSEFNLKDKFITTILYKLKLNNCISYLCIHKQYIYFKLNKGIFVSHRNMQSAENILSAP